MSQLKKLKHAFSHNLKNSRRALKQPKFLLHLSVREVCLSTFTRRHQILESLIESWKHGREVVVQEIEEVPESDCEQDVQPKEVRKPQGAINVTIVEGDPLTDQEVSEAEGETKPACDDSSEERLDENNLTILDDDREEKKSPDFSQIKMQPKILKRGRPKGAEVTVIGLPRKKKKKLDSQYSLVPFCRLSPKEKDKMILGALSPALAIGEAMGGNRLLNKEDILPVGKISDAIRDHDMVDIYRVEKYFEKEAWLSVVKASAEKNCVGFVCAVSAKMIRDECEDSIVCDGCLLWSHFTCTSLKKRPKNKNWFCNSCRLKYS